MFRLARRLFHPNAQTRRLLSGFLGSFLLAVLAFSSLFVSVEADHDCDGHECPVCQEMQGCIANFQLVGSATPSGDAPACPVRIPSDVSPTVTLRIPALTLLSLDVRFNE